MLLLKDKEYELVEREKYDQYLDEAYLLLEHVSDFFGIDILTINYNHIISYIARNFDISFVFYDKVPFEVGGFTFVPSTSWLKYPNLLPNPTFNFFNSVFVKNVSGTTIIDKNKYVMFINQNTIKGRVIFSILHEISHVYFHSYVKQVNNAFASLNTDTLFYKDEAVDCENEANVIASILFLPDEKLYDLIKNKNMTFEQICKQAEISVTALHNRIKNYLIYNCNCVHYYATSIVLQYRNGNSKDLMGILD